MFTHARKGREEGRRFRREGGERDHPHEHFVLETRSAEPVGHSLSDLLHKV